MLRFSMSLGCGLIRLWRPSRFESSIPPEMFHFRHVFQIIVLSRPSGVGTVYECVFLFKYFFYRNTFATGDFIIAV